MNLDLEVQKTREMLDTTAVTDGATANKNRNWHNFVKKVIIATTFISELTEKIKTQADNMSKNWNCYKIILRQFISNTGIAESEDLEKIDQLTQTDIEKLDINKELEPDKYIATLTKIKKILEEKMKTLTGGGKITKKKYHNKKKCRRYTKRSKKNMPKLNNKYKQRGGDGGAIVGICIGLFLFFYLCKDIDESSGRHGSSSSL